MNKLNNEVHVKISIRVFQVKKIINIKPFKGLFLTKFTLKAHLQNSNYPIQRSTN